MAASRKQTIRPCRLHDCGHRHCSACGQQFCTHQTRMLPTGKFLGTTNKLFCCSNHAKLSHWRRMNQNGGHPNGNKAK